MINKYNVIGLMSGTSLDGLDIAFCSIYHESNKWSFELNETQSIDYDNQLRQKLKGAIDLSATDLLIFNNDYGKWLGEQVNTFAKKLSIKADFIASHGHTVHHRPEKGITYQLGSGQQIANTCGLKVICDFRSKDVSLGGQGAPLVPVGDQHLLSEYSFCLNLGGISNVSFNHKGERAAYDIGLANMVLNYITEKIGLRYDDNGRMARSGELDKDLFNRLNKLSYYQLPFPKSTGYEWFAMEVIPLVDDSDLPVEDKLCTAVHHIAYTVAYDIKQFAEKGDTIFVTGGGAKNAFLIECLKLYIGDTAEVSIPEDKIIDFKEAIVFAFLGVLRERGEVNCLRSVTGASVDNCGGVIYQPS